MKICVTSNSLVNVTLILLYVASYCSVIIDRELRDVSDLLDPSSCDSISGAFFNRLRCKCSTISSIVSTNTGRIACIPNVNIDKSKYT